METLSNSQFKSSAQMDEDICLFNDDWMNLDLGNGKLDGFDIFGFGDFNSTTVPEAQPTQTCVVTSPSYLSSTTTSPSSSSISTLQSSNQLVPSFTSFPVNSMCIEKIESSSSSSNEFKKSSSSKSNNTSSSSTTTTTTTKKRNPSDDFDNSNTNINAGVLVLAKPQVQSKGNNKGNKRKITTQQQPVALKLEELEENRQKLSKKEFIRALYPSDLRMSYVRIITDAFNTGNSTLLFSALKSFCAPNCCLREYFSGVHNPYGPNYRELSGTEAIGYYWNLITSAIPDGVVTLVDVKVKQLASYPDSFAGYIENMGYEDRDTSSEEASEPRPHYPNEGLVIFNRYTFNGTKLQEIITEQSKAFNRSLPPSVHGPEIPPYGDPTIYLAPLNGQSNSLKCRPDLKMEGSWVAVLNRDNKISRFEFHYRNCHERNNCKMESF